MDEEELKEVAEVAAECEINNEQSDDVTAEDEDVGKKEPNKPTVSEGVSEVASEVASAEVSIETRFEERIAAVEQLVAEVVQRAERAIAEAEERGYRRGVDERIDKLMSEEAPEWGKTCEGFEPEVMILGEMRRSVWENKN